MGEPLCGLVAAYHASGARVGAFGTRGLGEGEIHGAAGLYVDAWSRIYVVDSQGAKVAVFREQAGKALETSPDRRR